MAIIKFGGGITDARGSLAGNTFTRSRAGSVVRQRVAPIQPNSMSQSRQRQLLASAVAVYTSFTTAQVAAWQALADQITKTNKLGDTYTPSAIQTFIGYYIDQSNIGRQSLMGSGYPPPSSAYQPVVDKFEDVNAEVTAGAIVNLNFTYYEATELDTQAIVKITPPHSAALQNPSKLYRVLGNDYASDSFAAGANIDIKDQYEAQFGLTAAVGEIIDAEVKAVLENGLSSDWYRVQFVLSAAA
jgi:hypothetical protein